MALEISSLAGASIAKTSEIVAIANPNGNEEKGTFDISQLASDFDLTAEEVEQLRDWISQLEDKTVDFAKAQDRLNQKLLDSFDNFTSKIEDQASKIEHLTNVLNHYKNIMI